MDDPKLLVLRRTDFRAVLGNALSIWADSTTRQTSLKRGGLLHDKISAASAFFVFVGKHPAEVTPVDVRAWRLALEAQGLKPTTVYARLSRLSSFYDWVIIDARMGEAIKSNPVKLARPKAPRAYQTESVSSLTDEQVRGLVALVKGKADLGSVVAKRDYALLLFYLVTGMRRSEVINLRSRDLDEREGILILRGRVKGSDYVEREVRDGVARAALIDYLSSSGRLQALKTDSPLWTRHDRAGKSGAALTSHAFARNLKLYGKQIGLERIHIHQTRHTYARMVAEETGSIIETQDALGHRHASTTRVYVQRIAVKRDKHSERIARRLIG
ncbi:MAG: tyrosine-type recombinase/integrase [Rubrivivax sp.]|nr:tyrosine-type recombinase/integrase [Pyrinomonadaceae bacterium]